MTQVSAQLVKELRDMTGAGMMDCKKALGETEGDLDKAVDFLRKKGLKNLEKRAAKVAAEGMVFSYIHPGNRVGVMLELNSETDFVARSEDFEALAKALAMHVAWSAPKYVGREDVPAEVIESEKAIYRAQLSPGQEKVADKIISGKLDKFFETVCMLEQFDAKDPTAKKRIGDLIQDLSAKVGEKIVLRRFSRYEVGEGIEKAQSDYAAEVAAAAASV